LLSLVVLAVAVVAQVQVVSELRQALRVAVVLQKAR
jgi:hypothetical protein